MLNLLIKIILVCSIALNIHANITSLTPNKDVANVLANIKIQITFDNPIIDFS